MATVNTTYDLFNLAQSHYIEPEDIDSISFPTGWLTTCAVIHTILDRGSRASDLNIVDPSWWAAWESEGYRRLEGPPEFFFPRIREPSPTGELANVRGLVAPFLVGQNHWVTVLIDLEENRAVLYDSCSCKERTREIKQTMQLFYKRFRFRFVGQRRKIKFVEGRCPVQEDESACGIIACMVSCLLLVRGELVKPFRLSEEDILEFRGIFAEGLASRVVESGARAYITPPGSPEIGSETEKSIESKETCGHVDLEDMATSLAMCSADSLIAQLALNTSPDRPVQQISPSPVDAQGSRQKRVLWSRVSNMFWYGWQRQVRKLN